MSSKFTLTVISFAVVDKEGAGGGGGGHKILVNVANMNCLNVCWF